MAEIVKDLKFHRIAGNAPVMTCNNCARTAKADEWLMADIPLDDSLDFFSIVVCSRRCARAFKAHPVSEAHVRKQLKEIKAMRAGGSQ